MPVLTTDSIQTTADGLDFTGSQTWTIAEGVICSSELAAGVYDGVFSNTRLINLGTVVSDTSSGAAMSGTGATVINGSSGVIAGTHGVIMGGTGTSVTNHGSIMGFAGAGIRVNFAANITNTGDISGVTYAIDINNGAFTAEIVNSGTISAPTTAIHIGAVGATLVTNTGTIEANFANCITSDGTGPVTIANFGFIRGALLGTADDFVGNAGVMGNVSLGAGADVYDGSASAMFNFVNGGDGNDTVAGGVHDDTLNGDANNDTLFGGRGDDTLLGGDAKDTIIGGRDDDTLTGGVKGDTFVFRRGFGHDTITDFAASGSNHDVIKLGHDLFADYADVSASMVQVGGDVLIRADNGDTILVVNVTLASMVAADFAF